MTAARQRRNAIIVFVVTAPSFAICDGCKAPIAGRRAYQWATEGMHAYGCTVCVKGRQLEVCS